MAVLPLAFLGAQVLQEWVVDVQEANLLQVRRRHPPSGLKVVVDPIGKDLTKRSIDFVLGSPSGSDFEPDSQEMMVTCGRKSGRIDWVRAEALLDAFGPQRGMIGKRADS